MKSFLLCGIAIASVLMLQPIPASAQRVHEADHARMGHGYASHGAGRFQYHHGGYARGYGTGYGIGVGAAALATGALIGGAIATQNQGYYPVQTYPAYSDQGYYPVQTYPAYSDQGYYHVQTYPAYSDPGYVYSDAAPTVYNNGGSVAYCEQSYRSYNPASGSYLGYDGFRHPCP
jgi:hypothetical protein